MFFFSKNKNKQNNKKRRIPSMPRIPGLLTSLIITQKRNCQRALLCTSKKGASSSILSYRAGSLTAEAAVILPLFLLAAFTLVSVVDICRIQTEEQTLLSQQAKKLAAAAYESCEQEYIDLAIVKNCKLPVSLIPGYAVPIALRGRVHGWIGRTDNECAADQECISDPLVYVTEHESVYHESSECTHLKLSIYGVDKSEVSEHRNEHGGRYHPCERCCSETGTDVTCYISPHGNRYHNSTECSGLTRTVKLVRASETEHLSSCTRCGGT